MEDFCFKIPNPVVPYKTSLPPTTDWPGTYNFCVFFSKQDEQAKHLNWIFSEDKKRLFVKKDFSCPIHFSTNVNLDNATIRAMVVFTSPESVSSVVTRCLNHSMEEIRQGVWEAEHIIRCESLFSAYQVDHESKRHSVVVPFENASVGQNFSTYIYKFMCFTSCAGGPNRRPLTLIFTLENEGTVIGRCAFHLKICASPQRDSRESEKVPIPVKNVPMKRMSLPLMCDTSFLQDVKKPKKTEDGKYYCIKVKDYECYTFLKQMQKAYEVDKAMSMIPTYLKQFCQGLKSSDEEEK